MAEGNRNSNATPLKERTESKSAMLQDGNVPQVVDEGKRYQKWRVVGNEGGVETAKARAGSHLLDHCHRVDTYNWRRLADGTTMTSRLTILSIYKDIRRLLPSRTRFKCEFANVDRCPTNRMPVILSGEDSYGLKAVMDGQFLRRYSHDTDKTPQVRQLLTTTKKLHVLPIRKKKLQELTDSWIGLT